MSGVINQLLSQGLITLTGDSLLLAGIVIVMLSLNAQLALVTFSIIPLIVLVTAIFAAAPSWPSEKPARAMPT